MTRILVACAILFLVAGCGETAGTATLNPANNLQSANALEPIVTPKPSNTPPPSINTPTFTQTATLTVTPTPTDTATPEPTATPKPTEKPLATSEIIEITPWEEAVENSTELFHVRGETEWTVRVHESLADVGYEAVVQDEERADLFVLNCFYLHAQANKGYGGTFEEFRSGWQDHTPFQSVEVVIARQQIGESELSYLATPYILSNRNGGEVWVGS